MIRKPTFIYEKYIPVLNKYGCFTENHYRYSAIRPDIQSVFKSFLPTFTLSQNKMNHKVYPRRGCQNTKLKSYIASCLFTS